MQVSGYRGVLLAVGFLALVWYCFSGPAVSQDRLYHRFADGRGIFGIPNGLNVLSNIPFLVVGIAGCRVVLASPGRATLGIQWLVLPYLTVCLGSALTAFGSAYYHLAPDNQRLAWDRLPMTLGFMGILAAVIGERAGRRPAQLLYGPLLLAGLASVLYWRCTEQAGHGDLRPYLLVQYGALALIVLLLLLYPARYTHAVYLWAALVLYAVAKVVEIADHQIFALGHVISGHTLKHLTAAGGLACLVRMIHVWSPTAGARSGPDRASIAE